MKRWEIMKASDEGIDIEVRAKDTSDNWRLVPSLSLSWDWSEVDYRVYISQSSILSDHIDKLKRVATVSVWGEQTRMINDAIEFLETLELNNE